MVNYYNTHLDQMFAALSDSTRRSVLARLARTHELSVSALAEPFDITLPEMMTHFDVLAAVAPIGRATTGRTRQVEITSGALKPAVRWLQHYERFWWANLDRPSAYVDATELKAPERSR